MLEELVASPSRIPEVACDFRDAGIQIIGLAGYRNLVAPDREVREKHIAFLHKYLELAPEFETVVVATEAGTRHPSSDWHDSPENASPQTWRLLEDFRCDYNQNRPHSRLGYLSPNQWIENNLQARTPLGLLASLRPGLSNQTTSTKP